MTLAKITVTGTVTKNPKKDLHKITLPSQVL